MDKQETEEMIVIRPVSDAHDIALFTEALNGRLKREGWHVKATTLTYGDSGRYLVVFVLEREKISE